jgi:hypothetical protein
VTFAAVRILFKLRNGISVLDIRVDIDVVVDALVDVVSIEVVKAVDDIALHIVTKNTIIGGLISTQLFARARSRFLLSSMCGHQSFFQLMI